MFAPTCPDEILVFPKDDISHILQTTEQERKRIAQSLVSIFPALFFCRGVTSLNIAMHMAPYSEMDEARKYYRWHMHIYPRRARLPVDRAGAEIGFGTQVIDTMPETDENRKRRISLLVNQRWAFFLLLKIPEYYGLLTHYAPMAVGLEDSDLLGAFYARLGDCEWSFGNFDQAIQTLTSAVGLCKDAGNIEEARYAYLRLQWSHFMRGDFDRALALKEDLIRTMEKQFNFQVYTYALSVASRVCSHLGRWDQAVEEAQKALSVAEEFSDNSLISWSAWNLSIAYTGRRDLPRAIEYAELAVEKAPTPADKAWAQRTLARALCLAGKPKQGIELLTAVLPILRAGGYTAAEIPLICYLGEAYWLAGEDDKARQTLEEGLEIEERCGARYFLGWARRLLGETFLRTDPSQAASHFEKSIAIFQEIKAENELAMAYAGYGRLLKKQGEIAQAREFLTNALEIFERLGTLIEPEKVRGILAELPAA